MVIELPGRSGQGLGQAGEVRDHAIHAGHTVLDVLRDPY
jgi:hypothetical protein